MTSAIKALLFWGSKFFDDCGSPLASGEDFYDPEGSHVD